MRFKLKHMIFGKIAIILCLCLVLNYTFVIKSYAEDATSMSPLFIPITQVVTAVALGTGIIAKNSEEAIKGANQLVQNVISNIKSSEIKKSESDPNYVSPFRVVNGGQPEKPSNDNKNGKWVALGAGALASNEIWTNKEAVKSIMSEINKLNGYNQTQMQVGYIDINDVINVSTTSAIALQLAKISNSAVTQFDLFLHSDFLSSKVGSEYSYDDFFYVVKVNVSDIIQQTPKYPRLYIQGFLKNENIKNLRVTSNMNIFSYRTYSNDYGSISFYYTNYSNSDKQPLFVNNDNVEVLTKTFSCLVNSRSGNQDFSYTSPSSNNKNLFNAGGYLSSAGQQNLLAYNGYKWQIENPWQFTNNVYNVNQTFEVNFPDWLQQSLNLLGQEIECLRLGLTTIQPSWNPTQEQIQNGLSPTNVINQYINNYENPQYIPDEDTGDNDQPIVVPPAIEEPQPTNDYLSSFLLPESITTKFPFCIPFDVARALRLFSVSQREAPKWECDLNYGSSTYHVVIDLTMFNDVASFVRPLEYIVFLVGLALGTRSLIRG